MAEPTTLPSFDLASVTRAEPLYERYAEVRGDGAVVARGEPLGGCEYWALLSYDAVRTATIDTRTLSSAEGMTIPPLQSPLRLIPVELDPPEHAKYHRFLVPEFRRDRVGSWSDKIREAVDRIIDDVIEQGEGDLIQIGRRVPPTVIAAILGVPEDGPKMVELTENLNRAAQAGDAEARTSANIAMRAYVDKIVTDAEGTGRADLLGMITSATVDGNPLSHVEAIAAVITIVIAGQETTVNGISSMLVLLGRQTDARRTLVEQPELIPAAVEESLRMESPVQMIARTLTADHEVDGCPMRKGDKVGLVLGAANYDPARFEDPGRFRLDRTSNPHIAFGHGVHRCIGEHLARLELIIVAEQVMRRMPDFELTAEPEHWANTAFNRGVRSVPVRFTPGARVYAD